MMEYILVISGTACIAAGLLGSVIPVLPGPPLGYAGLLLIQWTRFGRFSTGMLVIWAAIVAVVTVLDAVVPLWGTRRFGGTRAGIYGSAVGLVIGVVLLPMTGIVLGPFGLLGILGGPFVGAYTGEVLSGMDRKSAVRAATGSFMGFLAGTFMKVSVSLVLAFYFFSALLGPS